MKYQEAPKTNSTKIIRVAMIAIGNQRDVEFSEGGVESPEPVELLMNEIREELMNILRMDEESEQDLSF